MSSETIINDGILSAYADKISACEELDAAFAEYLSIIKKLKDSAIKSGQVHDSLEAIYKLANTVYEKNCSIGSIVAKEIDEFLELIEEVDLEVYRR